MRLEWEIRWEWKQRNDSETRIIILLVHRVSNARVVKERRGVFAGCYEYNENVSCRFLLSLLSLSLSLTVRDKLCNPAGIIRNFAGFNFLQSIHARFRIVIRFALTERYRSILFRSTDEKQISEIFCYLRTDITKNLLPVFSNGSTILMNCANFTRQT